MFHFKDGLQKLREIKRGVRGENCAPYLHMQDVKHIFFIFSKNKRRINFFEQKFVDMNEETAYPRIINCTKV